MSKDLVWKIFLFLFFGFFCSLLAIDAAPPFGGGEYKREKKPDSAPWRKMDFSGTEKNLMDTGKSHFSIFKSISKKNNVNFEAFVGSKACAECHQEEYNLWENATHAKAGGPPGPDTIISQFYGTRLQFKDAVVSFNISEDKDYEITVEQVGRQKWTFRVDAIVGGGLMYGGGTQALFSRAPDGTLRFLPFDYIKKEKLWFVQLKRNGEWIKISKEISLDDCFNWPPWKILGKHENFDSNCGNCHGSQIQVLFQPKRRGYSTRIKSLKINCESCHGPGKKHIELAKSEKLTDISGVGAEPLALMSKDSSLNVCFQCHAKKFGPYAKKYLPGKNFENHFSIKLLDFYDNELHTDGRVRFFGYQKNHLYSDCYLSGSMTCVDCHNPHSQKYRDIWGKELVGRFDDEQCLSCHESKRNAIMKHTHHKADSEGSLCISCHMPYLQHRGVGNKLRFARSDHTIPIPRPDYDNSLGIENACSKCHKDRTVKELQEITDEWYGRSKPHKPIVLALGKTGNLKDRKKAAQMLLDDTHPHPSAQVRGLTNYIMQFTLPDMPDLEPAVVEKMKALSQSKDMDLKALALASLHITRGKDAKIQSFLKEQTAKFGKREANIKFRWVLSLALFGMEYVRSGVADRARTSFLKALEISPDEPFVLSNLGIACAMLGKKKEALGYLYKAFNDLPFDANLHLNMGVLLNDMGDNNKA
ncbi:multiheme c-type cytochrome, partial [Candidatus Riflebacteria bacterium]